MNTDHELQLFLAKMLPEKLGEFPAYGPSEAFFFWWKDDAHKELGSPIKDTEWLHVCWLVEQTLNDNQYEKFEMFVDDLVCEAHQLKQPLMPEFPVPVAKGYLRLTSLSWQQRAAALKKVKGM
jgi:hypothetical protein